LSLQYQLREQLRGRLAAGWVPPGEKLPPLLTLARAAQVSRNTVRLALAALADEGIVQLTQGAQARLRRRPSPASALAHPLVAAGALQVERVARVGAPADVARLLGLTAAAEVYLCERLRLREGRAVALERLYLSVAAFADLERILQAGEPLYTALATRYDTPVVRAEERLHAQLLDSAIAARLQLPEPCVGIVIERLTFAAIGPIEVRYSHLANAALQTVLHLSRAYLASD
jgi:GntR family transcriptional regulator